MTEPRPVDDNAAARLRQQLEELRAELECWREKAHEHELATVRAEAARVLAEERTAAAKALAAAEAAAARAEIRVQERQLEELKAALAEARRPWWRRWRS